MYSKAQIAAANKKTFEVPKWAGLAPAGTHLNVMKGEKLVEKLIIDEKKCYYFGRNSDMCDFITEHASCSRRHAALVYHKHLNRMFVIDLGSMHGSFLRNLRLDAHKPTPVPFDTSFHFGASTRHYILKERPPVPGPSDTDKADEDNPIDLPKGQEELDNLTEYHTALNKRVTSLPIQEPTKFHKRKRKSVIFAEREEVINPEDIDSSVGRFRNMVSVEVIPNKRARTGLVSINTPVKKHVQEFYNRGLYEDLDSKDVSKPKSADDESRISSSFIPNLAPDVSNEPIKFDSTTTKETEDVRMMKGEAAHEDAMDEHDPTDPFKPKKKKYMKEAWPGKRPAPSLLV